jgi:hypothetical protein
MFKLRINNHDKTDSFTRILPLNQSKIQPTALSFRQKPLNNIHTSVSQEKTAYNNNLTKVTDYENVKKHIASNTNLVFSKIISVKGGAALSQLSFTSLNHKVQSKKSAASKISEQEKFNSPLEQSNFDCNCILCTTKLLRKNYNTTISPFSKLSDNWSLDTKKFFTYLDNMKPSIKIDRENLPNLIPSSNQKHLDNFQETTNLFNYSICSVQTPSKQNTSNQERVLSKTSRIKLWKTNEILNSLNLTQDSMNQKKSKLIVINKSPNSPMRFLQTEAKAQSPATNFKRSPKLLQPRIIKNQGSEKQTLNVQNDVSLDLIKSKKITLDSPKNNNYNINNENENNQLQEDRLEETSFLRDESWLYDSRSNRLPLNPPTTPEPNSLLLSRPSSHHNRYHD